MTEIQQIACIAFATPVITIGLIALIYWYFGQKTKHLKYDLASDIELRIQCMQLQQLWDAMSEDERKELFGQTSTLIPANLFEHNICLTNVPKFD
jgi:cbb3-type cytochrome oxidase subunit 3